MAVELDVSQLNLSLLFLGAYILLFGLFSFFLKEKLNIGESPIAILLGIALGPHGVFNVLDWAASGNNEQADALMLALSRIVLGIQLSLIGINLPFRFLRTELVSLLILIGPVMTMMWAATTACILAAIPSMPVLVAFIVAACTTATDPVLSNSIVKGQFADAYVSVRLRNLISAESGLNDGLGYPFLFLAVSLLRAATVGEALKEWALETLGWVILGSIVYGAVVGHLCLLLLRAATRNGLIDKESFLLYGTGMGIFIVGSAGALGTDDLLACFIAGNVFTWDDRYRVDTADDEVTNVIDLLLNHTFFLFVGLMIPFDLFNQPEHGITPGRLILLGVLVLIFRRLPALLLHYKLIPSIRDPSEAAFAGYLGPIGAGACFYASLVLEEFKADDPNPVHQLVRIYVKPITYALVIASIVGHSLAIPVLKAFLVYYDVGRIKLDDSASDHDGSDDASTLNAAAYETSSQRPDESASGLTPRHQTIQVRPGSGLASRPQSSYSHTSALSTTHSAIAASELLTPHHFEARNEHTPPSWRMSSGHKLPSAVALDARTGEMVYSVGAYDGPSAWTRAARQGNSLADNGTAEGSRARSRSRTRALRMARQQSYTDDLEAGNETLEPPSPSADARARQQLAVGPVRQASQAGSSDIAQTDAVPPSGAAVSGNADRYTADD